MVKIYLNKLPTPGKNELWILKSKMTEKMKEYLSKIEIFQL